MVIWALLLENEVSIRLSVVADAPLLTLLLDFGLQSVALALPLKRALLYVCLWKIKDSDHQKHNMSVY
jgi:hypothetical protein